MQMLFALSHFCAQLSVRLFILLNRISQHFDKITRMIMQTHQSVP